MTLHWQILSTLTHTNTASIFPWKLEMTDMPLLTQACGLEVVVAVAQKVNISPCALVFITSSLTRSRRLKSHLRRVPCHLSSETTWTSCLIVIERLLFGFCEGKPRCLSQPFLGIRRVSLVNCFFCVLRSQYVSLSK